MCLAMCGKSATLHINMKTKISAVIRDTVIAIWFKTLQNDHASKKKQQKAFIVKCCSTVDKNFWKCKKAKKR